MNALKKSFRNILHYPSALMGILVVLLLVFTAIYAMVKDSVPGGDPFMARRRRNLVSKSEICPTCLDQPLFQ